MDNKQKEQLKKGLVFGGLGLLCALSIWFIFAPSDKDKAEEQQGLNKDIPPSHGRATAKDQIISEAARGVMQGASQLLQKKLRTVKVTLKGGYRLFLVQTK